MQLVYATPAFLTLAAELLPVLLLAASVELLSFPVPHDFKRARLFFWIRVANVANLAASEMFFLVALGLTDTRKTTPVPVFVPVFVIGVTLLLFIFSAAMRTAIDAQRNPIEAPRKRSSARSQRRHSLRRSRPRLITSTAWNRRRTPTAPRRTLFERIRDLL